MQIIAVTGSIATGKSTAMAILAKKYPTIILDVIASHHFKKRKDRILQLFGKQILTNNAIDKKKVARIIFQDTKYRKEIEKIIHPPVIRSTIYLLLKYFILDYTVVFIEIPLFFEYNLDFLMDSIVVYCSENKQKERMINRDGNLNVDEKINVQYSIATKKEKATYVIDNSDGIDDVTKQLQQINFGGNRFSTLLIIVLYILIWLFLIK